MRFIDNVVCGLHIQSIGNDPFVIDWSHCLSNWHAALNCNLQIGNFFGRLHFFSLQTFFSCITP